MFFLDFFCGGIVSCSSAETRWAPMLGGNRKSGLDPRTQEKNVGKRSSQSRRWRKRRQRTSQKLLVPQKLWILLHVPSRPHLQGDEGTFTFRQYPWTQRIFLVWTHTDVFYISYIYKSATSSHIEPGLFEMTTLTLLLASSWISPFKKTSRTVTPEFVLHHIPEFHRFPKFVALQVHGFESSRIRDFGA
jgi:hypothetical protein